MNDTETLTEHGHTTAYRSPDGTTTMREWEHDHERGDTPHTHEIDNRMIMRELTALPNAATETEETTESTQQETGHAPKDAGEYTRRVWFGEK